MKGVASEDLRLTLVRGALVELLETDLFILPAQQGTAGIQIAGHSKI